MDGLLVLIIAIFFFIVVLPIALIVIGIVKWKRNREDAKVWIIIGVAILVIAGGSCLGML